MYKIAKQKGVAFVLLTCLFIPIAGMLQLAIEGSRVIQESNRLADGVEAATIAVSLANRGNGVQSKVLAANYVNNYLLGINTQVDGDGISVVYKQGKENFQGDMTDFIQYEVISSGEFRPWFNVIPSSGKNIKQNSNALAKTYQTIELQGQELDLVFVADASGSMGNRWGGNKRSKMDILKEQIELISVELISNSAGNNRIGLVPYAIRTQELINGELRCVTQINYKNIYGAKYEDIDWYNWANERSFGIWRCADNGGNFCPSYSTQTQAKAAGMVLRFRNLLDNEDFVDIEKTVDNWNVDKTGQKQLHPKFGFYGEKINKQVCSYTLGTSNRFQTQFLAAKKPSLDNLKVGGGTSVYQGLIRGAQILAGGKPADSASKEDLSAYEKRAKMLLILSDGNEDPFKNTFSNLVNKGLCDKFREHFTTASGESMLYIGVIGIAYQTMPAFSKCADDVIDVSDSDDLLEAIKTQIKQGISKKNSITRLYDKSLG